MIPFVIRFCYCLTILGLNLSSRSSRVLGQQTLTDQQLLNTRREADAAGIRRKILRPTLSSTQQEERASYLNQSEFSYEDFSAISEPYSGSSKFVYVVCEP